VKLEQSVVDLLRIGTKVGQYFSQKLGIFSALRVAGLATDEPASAKEITCNRGTIPPALDRESRLEPWTRNVLLGGCSLFWAFSWLLFPLDEDNPATVQLHVPTRKSPRSRW
jgi:hypothetical protein